MPLRTTETFATFDMKTFLERLDWNKRTATLALLAAGALFASPPMKAADADSNAVTIKPAPPNISVRNEVQHAIDKGLSWLEKHQNTNGSWSSDEHPALTALVLDAFESRPGRSKQQSDPEAAKNGYAFLESCVQSDGGIYRKDLPSYNTSVCLMAFVAANRPEYQSIIEKARSYLVGLQVDLGEPGKIDTPSDGGFGYGNSDRHPDLSNTVLALEALYFSKRAEGEGGSGEKDGLNYQAAIHFIQSCQNLPASNHESWASDNPRNKGGFIYAPGRSMAGETNLPSGKIALRSYGSMSYAGLLSYVYADLQQDDARVVAVKNWLRDNFSINENPGMGPQGLYYYYMVMAKALTLSGMDVIRTNDGRTVNWKEDLALKLINLQSADGSWVNADGRWWEKDPALDTAFSLIALNLVYPNL